MSTRDSYTDAEWATLKLAPLHVCRAVAGADNKIDRKETKAIINELSRAHVYEPEPLVRDVLHSVANDLLAVAQTASTTFNPLAELTKVADVLDERATREEGEAFKHTMMGLGVKIANASGSRRHGKVSDEERRALFAIAKTMRIENMDRLPA